MTTGQRIKKLREEKKMSMHDLANATNLDVSYISYLEAGKRNNPTVETLVAIAKVFGVEAWFLLKNDEGLDG